MALTLKNNKKTAKLMTNVTRDSTVKKILLNKSCKRKVTFSMLMPSIGCHDIQHNGTQLNDIQHDDAA